MGLGAGFVLTPNPFMGPQLPQGGSLGAGSASGRRSGPVNLQRDFENTPVCLYRLNNACPASVGRGQKPERRKPCSAIPHEALVPPTR